MQLLQCNNLQRHIAKMEKTKTKRNSDVHIITNVKVVRLHQDTETIKYVTPKLSFPSPNTLGPSHSIIVASRAYATIREPQYDCGEPGLIMRQSESHCIQL